MSSATMDKEDSFRRVWLEEEGQSDAFDPSCQFREKCRSIVLGQ